MSEDFWDPTDHRGMRRRIEEGTIAEWTRAFPAEYGGVRLEAQNIRLEGKESFSLADQKKAWMERRELSRPLKADLRLTDAVTGEPLDERGDVTLMKIPYFTDRGTFLHNGNSYTASSQSRLVPGIYTRRQSNGQLEAQINSRSGTGKTFRVALEPDTGQFRMRIGGSNTHLYSLLSALGVQDEEMEEAWGADLLEINRKKKDGRVLDRAYKKFVPEYAREALDDEGKAELIRTALNKAQVSKEVVNGTLGAYIRQRKAASQEFRQLYGKVWLSKSKQAAPTAAPKFDLRDSFGDVDDEGDEYQPIGIEGVMASSRKLLAINRGLDETDERSSLAFSKIYTPDKLLRERIRLDEGKLRRNLLRITSSRRDLSAFHHRAFDSYYQEMITKSPLTSPNEETNPFQLLAQQRRVTQMGPGGVGSSDAITKEMQAVQPSEFGFYSAFETPESERAGVDVRMTSGTKVGSDGRLRQRFKDLRTGEVKWMSPRELVGKSVKIPD
jgi:DNA-directed RNA polymerase beta subunit